MTNPQNYAAVFMPHSVPEPIDEKREMGVNYTVDSAEQRDYNFWCAVRQGLLLQVDAIERKLGMPRTAEIRKQSNCK